MNNKVFRSRTIGVMRILTLAKPWAKTGCLTLVGLLWFGVLTLRADTHYVSLDGTNDVANGYNTWAGAATQIQWAVDTAAASDMVLVSNGTYTLTNQIYVTNNCTLKSLNGTNVTFINGNYPNVTIRCLYVSNSVLDGFTVSNGYNVSDSIGGGGGVFLKNGSVLNCLICWNVCSNSAANFGGGGICFDGTGNIISNCAVLNNTVPDTVDGGGNRNKGGGVFAPTTGDGIMIASRISGNTAGSGGGLYNNGFVVTNCVVDGNQAQTHGGGIALEASYVTDCVISNNVVTDTSGSAGGVGVYGAAKLLNSTVIGNVASYGGGIRAQCAAQMSNCQVIANTASNHVYGGGGVYLNPANWTSYGTPVCVEKCVIANNVSYGWGAGLVVGSTGGTYADYPTPNAIIRNCLISGNTNRGTDRAGGGVFLQSGGATKGPAVLINCTITGNKNDKYGGGLADYSQTNYSGCGGAVINCIVYSNTTTGDDYDEVYNANARNTNNYFYSCMRPTAGADTTPAPNQGNITNDPAFVNAGAGNYRPTASSPCVNTGVNHNWMTNSVDMDGRTRIRYKIVDMGAYEIIYQGTVFSIF